MEHLKGLAEDLLFVFKVLFIIKFFNIAEVSWNKIIMPLIMTFVMLGIMYLISQEEVMIVKNDKLTEKQKKINAKKILEILKADIKNK